MTAGTALGAAAPIVAATAAAAGATATATAGATAGMGKAPTATASPGAIPRTLAIRHTTMHGRLRVEQTAFGLSHLGVTWQGPVAQVRLRTAVGWTEWQTINGCGGGRGDGPGREAGNAVLVAPGVVGYEVWVAGGGSAQVAELNTVDGPATMMTAAAVANGMPLPDGTVCPVPYLSRAAWGADESQRTSEPLTFFPAQTLTVHHSGFGNNDPDPAATVRGIYYNDVTAPDRLFSDIGYQLLIDEAGQVYEGCWTGPDAVPGFGAPGADGRQQMVTGAHVGGWNSGNFGICLLGDLTSRQPTAAARYSLVKVLAALARVCRLDPLGTTNFVNPVNAATKTVKTVPGHRDWAATECPGNAFYPQLPALRTEVARWRALTPRRPGR